MNLAVATLFCGIAGAMSAFLGANSIWQMHDVPGFMVPVLVTVIGFVAAAVMGAMAVARPPLQKWQSIVALVGSVASIYMWQKAGFLGEIVKLAPLLKDHSASSILFSLGCYGGAVTSIIALARRPAAE